MRSRLLRRRAGLFFSVLLVSQGFVFPLGICGQSHESGHTPTPGASVVEHVHVPADGHEGSSACCDAHAATPDQEGSTAADVRHDGPLPQHCSALSACGVPALSAASGPELAGAEPPTLATVRTGLGAPPAVARSITSPPPKVSLS